MSAAARNALILIAVIASAAALKWLADILTPLALALFLMVMIDGCARVLKARVKGLPGRAAQPVAILIFVISFGLLALLVADNARSFASELIAQKPRLEGLLQRLGSATGFDVPPTLDAAVAQVNPSSVLGAVALSFQNFAGQAIFVVIYLGFLLASRQGFQKKADRLFDEEHELARATAVFVRIRDGIERYLWIQTVTGLMIAAASFALMMVLGMSNAFFWAFLIFVASYIPIIGGFVGIALPPVFALVQFDTYWQAVVLLAALQTIQFIVGNVVQPKMQGESLNVDPVVVLLALALWGALWGVPGMFLSTPLTVMAMIILAQFPSTRWIAILLSGNGRPEKLSDGPSDPSKPPTRRRPPPEDLAPDGALRGPG